jgi:hypothetical protein
MDLMPLWRREKARRSTSVDLGKPVLNGRRERATFDRKGVVQGAKATANRADRSGWVCFPPVIDCVLAWQARCHDPSSGFVGALIQQPRNRSKGHGPLDSSSFRS